MTRLKAKDVRLLMLQIDLFQGPQKVRERNFGKFRARRLPGNRRRGPSLHALEAPTARLSSHSRVMSCGRFGPINLRRRVSGTEEAGIGELPRNT